MQDYDKKEKQINNINTKNEYIINPNNEIKESIDSFVKTHEPKIKVKDSYLKIQTEPDYNEYKVYKPIFSNLYTPNEEEQKTLYKTVEPYIHKKEKSKLHAPIRIDNQRVFHRVSDYIIDANTKEEKVLSIEERKINALEKIVNHMAESSCELKALNKRIDEQNEIINEQSEEIEKLRKEYENENIQYAHGDEVNYWLSIISISLAIVATAVQLFF